MINEMASILYEALALVLLENYWDNWSTNDAP